MKTLQEFTIVFDQDVMIQALAAELARQNTTFKEEGYECEEDSRDYRGAGIVCYSQKDAG